MACGLVLPRMPETKVVTKRKTIRKVCFTSFKIQEYTKLPDRLSYFAFGLETCPTTGRQHMQGFAYAIAPMRFATWQKVLPPGSHIEAMKGSFTENDAYCSKEGQLKEFGERPMDNGKHRSDLFVKRAMEEDPTKTVYEIYHESEEVACVQHSRFFERYQQYLRGKQVQGNFEAPNVTYIYGPPGCGKTRFVYQSDPGVYCCPSLQWFDGYSGQKAVLLDNIEPSSIGDRVRLLQILDRYPVQVPVKGGFVWWKPEKIYITSIYHPDELSRQFSHPNEFMRRVTVFKDMNSV